MKNPRIYVGTWAKYNAGSLSGEWLALKDYESYSELCEVMRAIHEDESDPETNRQDFYKFISSEGKEYYIKRTCPFFSDDSDDSFELITEDEFYEYD